MPHQTGKARSGGGSGLSLRYRYRPGGLGTMDTGRWILVTLLVLSVVVPGGLAVLGLLLW